jgi:hypothetical protein
MLSSVDCITTTPESEFLVHTGAGHHEHRNAQSPTVEPGSFVTFLCTMSAIFLDFVSVKAQRNIDRDANAKRSVLQSYLSIGTLLSVPFVRSEACRAKGNHMRTLVEPPPLVALDDHVPRVPPIERTKSWKFLQCSKVSR